jgi:hypothetical protein
MAGSGSIIQDHGSADPKEIFRDPQHFCPGTLLPMYRCYLPYVVVIPIGRVAQIFAVPILLFLTVENLFIFIRDSSLYLLDRPI